MNIVMMICIICCAFSTNFVEATKSLTIVRGNTTTTSLYPTSLNIDTELYYPDEKPISTLLNGHTVLVRVTTQEGMNKSLTRFYNAREYMKRLGDHLPNVRNNLYYDRNDYKAQCPFTYQQVISLHFFGIKTPNDTQAIYYPIPTNLYHTKYEINKISVFQALFNIVKELPISCFEECKGAKERGLIKEFDLIFFPSKGFEKKKQ